MKRGGEAEPARNPSWRELVLMKVKALPPGTRSIVTKGVELERLGGGGRGEMIQGTIRVCANGAVFHPKEMRFRRKEKKGGKGALWSSRRATRANEEKRSLLILNEMEKWALFQ